MPWHFGTYEDWIFMKTLSTRQAIIERQLERVGRRLKKLEELDQKNKGRTLMVVAVGVFLTVAGLATVHWLGFIFLLATCAGFFLLARFQPNVNQSVLRYQVWIRLLQAQIARLHLEWAELPPVPPRDEEEEMEMNHPYELDLDISGERSLHRLLNTGVSQEGMLRLRDWLLELEPDLPTIEARRALVRELIPMTRFRDKLMIYSLFATRYSTASVDGDRLLEWLEDRTEVKPKRSSLIVALVFAGCFYLSLLLTLFVHVPVEINVVTLALCVVWYFTIKKEQGILSQDAHAARTSFDQLKQIFRYLESYRYAQKSQLRQLCEPFFIQTENRPSLLLNRINGLLGLNSIAAMPLVNLVVPIGELVAYRMERCKDQIAQHLPTWLDIWYELEATSSLANFAYLHPNYTFPEIVTGDQSTFEAKGLGHPLIADERKVPNDFQMAPGGEILLLTGSNMSGKSTFLRTIGINMCLAYAGSVVNATSFRTSIFELYGCIRVTDSLADGYSYFYAEVRRLKGLLDRLNAGPLYPIFFLIDEIFKGTNNYERLIGSEAYMRALVDKHCIGAITTHDLELVKLSESFPIINNYHFREDVIKGKMVFEYRLRRGPSPTRNALRIMQMEGLPVRWDTPSTTKA
jgi:hypothetical protein